MGCHNTQTKRHRNQFFLSTHQWDILGHWQPEYNWECRSNCAYCYCAGGRVLNEWMDEGGGIIISTDSHIFIRSFSTRTNCLWPPIIIIIIRKWGIQEKSQSQSGGRAKWGMLRQKFSRIYVHVLLWGAGRERWENWLFLWSLYYRHQDTYRYLNLTRSHSRIFPFPTCTEQWMCTIYGDWRAKTEWHSLGVVLHRWLCWM